MSCSGPASPTLVIPRAPTVPLAAAYGALFGLVVYGVYDFTNYATLRQWPLVLAFADVAWGVVASAICAVAVKIVVRVRKPPRLRVLPDPRRFQNDRHRHRHAARGSAVMAP